MELNYIENEESKFFAIVNEYLKQGKETEVVTFCLEKLKYLEKGEFKNKIEEFMMALI